jgi:hypothetical protein
MSIRVSFMGPSNVGKTTSARIMAEISWPASLISVASPLRAVETRIYEIAGVDSPESLGLQDGALLQDIRDIFDRVSPTLLEDTFTASVGNTPPGYAIINDDARGAMQDILRQLSFDLVGIRGPRRMRPDHSQPRVTASSHDLVIPLDECDYIIDNGGTLADLRSQLLDLTKQLRQTDEN